MSARSCDGWGTILVVLIVTALAGCDADLESGRGGKFRPGLSGTYYALYLEPVVERVDPNVDFAWGEAEPAVGVGADAFSVRWLGQLRGTTTGPYTLSVESDDGVRLWIDGALLVDGWAVRSETRNDTTISLEAGRWVDLRMEYFDSVAAASVRLLWTPPGGAEEVIPSSALRTASSDTVLPGPKPPYTNPTVPYDCPDPGVLRIADDPAEYAMVCTGGRFPIRISRDLVRWADAGTTVLDADKPP
ncbi:MAG: hypothetical protein KC417_06270, partial [Myxococcales bacterium]|nr:hypothetical protein [Myxococcales bacterium]